MKQTFRKNERLCSRSLLNSLFAGDGKSFSVYPIRVVAKRTNRTLTDAPVVVMINVPKRLFKHAVDRNRVKRQLREAYRKNKELVWQYMEQQNAQNAEPQALMLAFLWLSSEHVNSQVIEKKMVNLLHKVAEN